MSTECRSFYETHLAARATPTGRGEAAHAVQASLVEDPVQHFLHFPIFLGGTKLKRLLAFKNVFIDTVIKTSTGMVAWWGRGKNLRWSGPRCGLFKDHFFSILTVNIK